MRVMDAGSGRKFLFAAVPAASLALLLLYFTIASSKNTLLFQARGENGDEIIRVTKDGDAVVLLDDTVVEKQFKQYRIENIGDFKNIRIYFLNRPDPAIPRIVYLRNGLVKLSRMNFFGDIVSREDLLNRSSSFHDLAGKQIFDKDSYPMAVNRSGIMGWSGYLELYP